MNERMHKGWAILALALRPLMTYCALLGTQNQMSMFLKLALPVGWISLFFSIQQSAVVYQETTSFPT